MKFRIVLISFLMLFTLLTITSCKKNKGGSGSKTSAYNDDVSHNVGTACMNCHYSGGSNEYWWTVAGTVYKPDSTDLNPNSTVYLFSSINGGGNLIFTLPVDGKANFYTTSSVNFGTGLYPEVKSASGEVKYMQQATVNGNCNSCHNASKRIVVN